MKKGLFLALFSVMLVNAQQNPKRTFADVSAHFGYNLSNLINENNIYYEDSNIHYGLSAQMGFQPWKRFALAGGMRYNFVQPNFHLLQVFAQPYWFFNKIEREADDLPYITLKYGKQLNKSAVQKSDFVGIAIGRYDYIKKNWGHKYELGLDWYDFNGDGFVFVGVSYGIFITK